MKEIFDKLDMEKLWKSRGRISCPFSWWYAGEMWSLECDISKSPCAELFPEFEIYDCPCLVLRGKIFAKNRFWKRVEEWNINRLMGRE